jgi:hypothetical protein
VIDVIQVQVTMRVPRDAAVRPVLYERAEPGQPFFGQPAEPVMDGQADGEADVGRRLGEVLPGICGDHVAPAECCDGRATSGRGMERGQPIREPADDRFLQGAAAKPSQQRRLVGQTPHLYRPFNNIPRPLED